MGLKDLSGTRARQSAAPVIGDTQIENLLQTPKKILLKPVFQAARAVHFLRHRCNWSAKMGPSAIISDPDPVLGGSHIQKQRQKGL